jgi:hypothetical protein
MIHGNFAQLGDFERKTEKYSFSAKMSLNHESLLIGASTSLVVRPALYINGRAAKISNLKNVNLVVTTMNYVDKVPVTKNFSGLEFENDKELIVNF